MSESIGNIIKKLRKQHGFTQEELAEQLNVTPQAISKWENGSGMPDISQIVPLASVFGVSTDVIFGTSGTNDDEEVEKILNEAESLKNGNYNDIGMLKKQYPLLASGLKRFPGNQRLLLNCLCTGAFLALSEKENETLFRECERQAYLIINYGKSIEDVLYARFWLIKLYSGYGYFEKAREQADNFPYSCYYNYGSQMEWILQEEGKTEEELEVRCMNFSSLLESLEDEIVFIGNIYRKTGNYDAALKVYKTAFNLVSAIYGDEKYTPPLSDFNWEHGHIASTYMGMGDYENALIWLEKMVSYNINTAKSCTKIRHIKNPLLSKIDFDFPDDYKYPAKRIIEENLKRPEFDPLRGSARFKALEAIAAELEE